MTPDEDAHHQRFLRALTAHEPALRAYVRRLVPSRVDADDVMQETAVTLWKKFEEFREGGEFRAWAFGIARMKALSWLRDKGRDRLFLAGDVLDLIANEASGQEPVLAGQRRALDSCVEKLTPVHRDLLMAAYQPGVRIQDVAEQSGRTVAGFYQWLHRVRLLLLDCVRRELRGQVLS